MNVRFNGSPQSGVTSKDIVLYLIRKIGTAGGNGHAIEFSGSYINSISMEARMTICNMSIEGEDINLVNDEDSMAGHFLHILHGKTPSDLHRKVMEVVKVLTDT